MFQLCILPISIHAPPRGATSHTPGASARPGIFQFTPLREGRPHPGARRFHFSISIHAPPRGATRYEVTDAASGEFQFTPLREGRPEMPDYWLRAPGYFNSRPSARGDPPHMPMAGKETYFNSRRSARGDRAYRRGWSISRYFNSRPSARGDSGQRPPSLLNPHFNSRPSARGDFPRASRCAQAAPISIHAPPRGATSRADLSADGILFQFTPLREGRPCGGFRRFRCLYFNSRPSARGDKRGAV